MDFTPEDMEAVQACLEGIDRNVPVAIEPAAAVLLMPNTVRTVGDILILPRWPAEQLSRSALSVHADDLQRIRCSPKLLLLRHEWMWKALEL